MKQRIAVWAGVGFAVAGCWAVLAIALPPETFLTILQEPLVRAALYLSCPIAYVGRFYPIGMWSSLAANAATYAAFGLILEALRLPSKPRLLA